MGKEILTVELDAELMERLRAQGIEPAEYLQRMLERGSALWESLAEREARATAWREENAAEIEAHRKFIVEHGIWCEDIGPI